MDGRSNEKRNLMFACKWYKNRELTWSGTAWALYQGLQEYFEIEDFEMQEGIAQKIARRVRHDNNYGVEKVNRQNQKMFEKKYGKQKKTIFTFAECPYTENTVNYVYQDLSISYLQYLKAKRPDIFAVSEYDKISDEVLCLRDQLQSEYYMHCSGIFTMGKWLADFLVEQCGIPAQKVHAVGGGINVDASRIDTSRKQGNKLLFVGRNFQRKGGEIVLEGFRILRDQYMPKAELYILGTTKNPLEQEEKGIHFIGNVPAEELSDYYNMCDVFCMPSYFEAYGLVFIEALCYGLPCIGRNRYAMKEFIEEGVTGRLIEQDDAKKMAETMYELLTNKTIQKNVMERRDWYLHEYSWSNVCEKISRQIIQDAE